MKFFLAPRSNETSYQNFLSTIESGLDYTIVEPYLDPEGKKILSKTNKVFAWGNKESLKSRWEKMNQGDIVLFYKGREGDEKEGKFVYAGQVIYKQHSNDLGLALWPPKKGEELWNCVYFLDNLTQIYLPLSEIVNFGSYSEKFDRLQGFMPLNSEGNKVINKKFKNIQDFLNYYKPLEPFEISDLEEESDKITAHSEAQLYLLKIGQMLNYETFCPDKSAKAFGETLSDYITLDKMPARFLGEEVKKVVQQIDVMWFKDEVPVCAFEVEHTTGISKGLQRLSQLIPLSTKLFIVSSAKHQNLYDKYIGVDPFYKFKRHYRFKTYKQLENYFRAVSEFHKVKESFFK